MIDADAQTPMPAADADRLCRLLALHDGAVVAVIGAGGKHTLMYRLSEELAADGRAVVLTSTTNLHCDDSFGGPAPLLLAHNDDWPAALPGKLAARGRLVVVDSPLRGQLFKGLDPTTVDRLRAALPEAVTLVKADGARKRLLKAPGEHEPVYPSHVDVCLLVLSLNAIGKPLTEQHVHRLERVHALAPGEAITPETLVAVSARSGGYADRLPPAARRLLYLSGCDTPGKLALARSIGAATRATYPTCFSGDTITGRFWRVQVGT